MAARVKSRLLTKSSMMGHKHNWTKIFISMIKEQQGLGWSAGRVRGMGWAHHATLMCVSPILCWLLVKRNKYNRFRKTTTRCNYSKPMRLCKGGEGNLRNLKTVKKIFFLNLKKNQKQKSQNYRTKFSRPMGQTITIIDM